MRRVLFVLLVLGLVALPAMAGAQSDCPPVAGITCDGWVTDTAGVIDDDARLEDAVSRVVESTGNQLAIVVVDSSPGNDPAQLAIDIGNEWGVGEAGRDNGVVVVVDLGARRTEIQTGPGAEVPNASFIAGLGDSFFAGGDFDGGIAAIIGGLETTFTEGPIGTPDGGSESSFPSVFVLGLIAVVVLGVGSVVGGAVTTTRAVQRRRTETASERRKEKVQLELSRLEPAGYEVRLGVDFLVPQPALEHDTSTARSLAALRGVADGQEVADRTALHDLWALDVIDALDESLIAEYRAMPLELMVTNEQQLLEDAVQETASVAQAEPNDAALETRLGELRRLVEALRPYRIAEATTRLTRALALSAVASPIGPVVLTDLGERMMGAAPVLDGDQPISATVTELAGAYATARDKTRRVRQIHAELEEPASAAAVSAALADVGTDVDATMRDFQVIIDELEGTAPDNDGISRPALAAFLLMNNDATAIGDFLVAYDVARKDHPPGAAVEYALAGVQTRAEIAEAREAADSLGLPVAIAVALTRRGDRAVDHFRTLESELVDHGVTGDDRRTIAALLALSLEPAVALDRWVEARRALESLGLAGAYANVAAAFGASDPRGPRSFAIAYAAQRQALARADIEDIDRFAPELAHGGTSDRTDTWTGQPIPAGLRSYDPLTFLYYHWIITGGTGYGHGWAPIYRDHSWATDRDSWFGGGGGFGSSGSWSGGSSWGSSWGGGGGFVGFGGGGGFGGGFGGGGGGGSGW